MPRERDYSLPRHTNDSIIAQLRIQRGMTQAQLAEAIGTSQQQLAQWENGGRKPKLAALTRLAQALGVDLMTLVNNYTKESK